MKMTLCIGFQVLMGLHFLHDKMKTMHRDLKAESIFVRRDGRVKLGDFGSAYLGSRGASSRGTTEAVSPPEILVLQIDAKYDVYLKRQTADVDAFRRDEGLLLTDVNYADVPGLSNEARAKLQKAQPRTVGQAGRIDGMTPAALGILAAYLRREARRKATTKVSA